MSMQQYCRWSRRSSVIQVTTRNSNKVGLFLCCILLPTPMYVAKGPIFVHQLECFLIATHSTKRYYLSPTLRNC